MNNFYKLERDIIRIDTIDVVSKREDFLSEKSSKDDWTSKGDFFIVINDEKEYRYNSAEERDCVYNDLLQKLMMPEYLEPQQGTIFTDKQALALILWTFCRSLLYYFCK